MPNKKMLIDATHPEETRVVVLNGKRLEDFDVEVASKRQLKGNIYLAKVTRVEPSLQAAFVDYGGNRHGFLAFSEIHPDYYQIPVADREALLAEQEAASIDEEDHDEPGGADDDQAGASDDATPNGGDEAGDDEHAATVAEVGGDDLEEVESRRPVPAHKRYKIQEVIKRRQIMLVQVVKEERGNKGAALTTYLSLAGRYCVLMPNTARGGGISRKIATAKDRKRLKDMMKDLSIPEGMAVIVRTAGAERTKAEIKRDYEYLLRQWNKVRETTLESTAPALVYEEGDIIKRAIRDLYNSDIDEVVVDGDEGYRQAKDFMKLLIPSHAKKVQPYKDESMPLLRRYQVESQMDAMHSPEVQLRSGGYIVINPTEALVAIDVNSGKATRERNIEETALKTNLEAAEEVARQLRLRDLAGLIVIDFIDMERSRNQTQVERRLKDSLKVDRARIQVGRISPFGLMEMSRQRLRPSLHETSFDPCPYCAGTGVRRSTDSTALYVLRAIEEEGLKRKGGKLTVFVPTAVALYILNNKRATIAELEARHGYTVLLEGDDALIPPDFRIERVAGEAANATVETVTRADSAEEQHGEDGSKRKRRRRRRGRRGDEETTVEAAEAEADGDDTDATEDATDMDADADDGEEHTAETAGEGENGEPRKRRRRGRRGGRRRRKGAEGADAGSSHEDGDDAVPANDDGTQAPADEEAETTEVAAEGDDAAAGDADGDAVATDETAAEKPKRRRRSRRTAAKEAPAEVTVAEDAVPTEEAAPVEETALEIEEAVAEEAVAEEAAVEEAVAEETVIERPAAEAIETPIGDPAPLAETLAAANDADPEEDAARRSVAAKTTVIDLSAEKPADQPTKRGWWRR